MPPDVLTADPTTAAPADGRAPGPYRDHDAIKNLVRAKMTEWEKGRENLVVAAWFNILFYRGHQWVRYDRLLKRIRPAVLPRKTPTPVTNKFAETMDAVISLFARVEPKLQFRPGSEEPEDRATADVADRAIEVIEDEVKIRPLRQQLAAWVGLTGIAWIETGYDPDLRHGTRLLQHEACVMCGMTTPPSQATQCPACGGQQFIPATDAQGQPVGEQVPIGKIYADVVSIFEMFFDSGVTDWTRQTKYCRKKSVLIEESEARWPHLKGVIRPNVTATGVSELYTESLPTLGPNLDDTQGLRHMLAGAGRRPENTRVTEEWFWALPDATYPDGLLAVIVGGEHVGMAGPLPYSGKRPDGSGTPFLPHVQFQLKIVPGTGWGKTVADDLRLKQAQRNRIESLIEAILMRCGNPIWLRPIGSGAINLTGEPGQVVDYNPLGPVPGAKPERIPGQSIPAGLMNYMALIDKDFESLAGTFDILKGARPEGVSAGIALQILQERGMSRWAPVFILWESAWAEWSRQALEIFRDFVTEPRLRRIKGRDSRWKVEKFLGADLQGQVDVIAEAASAMPRSSLVERAETEQLAAIGVLPLNDPEVRFSVLEMYGKSHLLPGLQRDTENAIRENEVFDRLAEDPRMAAVPPEYLAMIEALDYPAIVKDFAQYGIELPQVYPSLDDHAVHGREHGNYGKSEHFRAFPRIIQVLLEKKKALHDLYAAEQMQALTAARRGTNAAAGFLAPTVGPRANQTPMQSGSSPDRLEGEGDEMGRDVAAGAGMSL